MLHKLSVLIPLVFTPLLLVGCQSSSTPAPVAPLYTLGYGTGAAQTQTVAAGSSTTLPVNVTGGSNSGLALSATVNNGNCTLTSSTASTDASGNASFSVQAGPGGGLGCTVTVNLLGVAATRSNVGFALNIREIQRSLSASSSTLNVPTTPTATTLDLSKASGLMSLSSPHAALGSSNDSFTLRISGLPAAPAGYLYALWKTDAASVTTALDSFKNTSNGAVNLNYTSPPPTNTGSSSATPVDNRANFSRVFVTLESGNTLPATPGSLLVLDTADSVFTQSL